LVENSLTSFTVIPSTTKFLQDKAVSTCLPTQCR